MRSNRRQFAQRSLASKFRCDKRYRRKNRAFRRQGEWFFVPEPSLVVNENSSSATNRSGRGLGKPTWSNS